MAEKEGTPPVTASKEKEPVKEDSKDVESSKPVKEEEEPPKIVDRELLRMRDRDLFRMRGRSRRERDMEMFRMRRMMMRRHGYDRELCDEMEMEMMHRLYGEEFVEPAYKEPTEEEKREQEKTQDRHQLVYWINTQMLPTTIPYLTNQHDMHDQLLKFVRAGRFEAIFNDSDRFQVNYISYHDIPTMEDMIEMLCKYAIAAFNNREEDFDKVFILFLGIEEDKDTKRYPLATGIPYLEPYLNKEKQEELVKSYRKVLRRGSKRRHGIKDSDFSSIDEGMTKFSVVECVQRAARHPIPIPPVGIYSIHPNWMFCNEWCYMYGFVDDNRKYNPKPHDFINGRPEPMIYAEKIQRMEEYLYESYQSFRRDHGYI